MKISVVIPAYNASASILAAIRSAEQQQYPAHEIIVVDDCSTDDTVRIVLENTTAKLMRLPVNSGPSAARNTGWDAATGDYVAFLDSDDVWLPRKLDVIAKVLEQQPGIQFLGHAYTHGTAAIFNEQEKAVRKSYFSILLRNSYQPSCLVVKRELALRFDESYRYCEDHELAIRTAHHFACHWLNMPLTVLGRPQLTAGGASGNIWKMRKGELRLYASIYRHHPAYIMFIPVLWMFSLVKMTVRILK